MIHNSALHFANTFYYAYIANKFQLLIGLENSRAETNASRPRPRPTDRRILVSRVISRARPQSRELHDWSNYRIIFEKKLFIWSP